MPESDLDVVRRGFDLYAAGDPAIGDIAHEDIEVTPLAPNLLTHDRPYRGREEVGAWAVGLAQAGFRVVPREFRELGGGSVLVTGVIVAEQPGRPGSAARAVWVVEVLEGKVVKVHAHHSEEEALRAANVEE